MKKLWCRLFGHKIIFAPLLPAELSCQNWYDTLCARCGEMHTYPAGKN